MVVIIAVYVARVEFAVAKLQTAAMPASSPDSGNHRHRCPARFECTAAKLEKSAAAIGRK